MDKMAYLKYYICNYNGGLSLNCVTCEEGQEPPTPENFVEWYDKDKWEYVPPPIRRLYETNELCNYLWSGCLRRKSQE